MRKIILDVDTGTDDAIAIMAAVQSTNIDLVAICSVHGNTSVINTTENSLRAVFAAGGDVPVYPGAREPLVKNLYPKRAVKVKEPVLSGTSEIDGASVAMNPDLLPLPKTLQKAENEKAALFYLHYLREAKDKVTLVATGTLTNLALALTMDPGIVRNIEEIVIMGGGIQKTNITAAAEANFFKDPEASEIVLRCGAPITICTLDATHSCSLDAKQEEKIRSVGTTAAIFTANDIHVRRESYNKFQPLERRDTAPIHDALCIAYLIDPSVVITAVDASCAVDCSEGISDGRLQMDRRYYHEKNNVKLILKADSDIFCGILVDVFSGRA